MKSFNYLSVFCALFAGNVFAESKWGIGVGGVIEDEGYVDIGTEINAIPVIYYETENFYLLGPRLGYELGNLGDVELTLLGQYRFDGYEVEDGDIFTGMEERGNSFDMGVELEYETDFGDVSFEYLTDVSGEHKGHEMSLTYSLPFVLENGVVSPYVTVTQYSDDLVDFYYGVRADEATATRPFYEGTSTINFEVGVQSDWMFGDHHMVVANASFNRLGSEIEDSPLIDTSTNIQFILGYVYVF